MSISTKIEEKEYDRRLSIILEVVAEFYLKYYGIDKTDKILRLINDVRVVEGGEEFLTFLSKNLIGIEQTGNDLPEEVIRESKGIFYSSPIINYFDDKYVLSGNRSLVAINENKIENTEDLIGLIAHEMFSHAERSQDCAYSIDDKIIIGRSGFYIETGKLSRDDYGNVKIEWLECKNIGIEEALAVHFECEAVREITGNNDYEDTIKDYGPLLRIIKEWIEVSPNIVFELQSLLKSGKVDGSLSLIFKELDNLLKLIYDRSPERYNLEKKIIELIKNRKQIKER